LAGEKKGKGSKRKKDERKGGGPRIVWFVGGGGDFYVRGGKVKEQEESLAEMIAWLPQKRKKGKSIESVQGEGNEHKDPPSSKKDVLPEERGK